MIGLTSLNRFVGVVSLIAYLNVAQVAAAAIYWRKPRTVRGFERYQPELQRLVDTWGRPGEHRFCVVVRDIREPKSRVSEGDRQELVVYWPRDREIFFYGRGASGRPNLESQDFGATINLDEDVVATADDRLIEGCRRHGTNVVLQKRVAVK